MIAATNAVVSDAEHDGEPFERQGNGRVYATASVVAGRIQTMQRAQRPVPAR